MRRTGVRDNVMEGMRNRLMERTRAAVIEGTRDGVMEGIRDKGDVGNEGEVETQRYVTALCNAIKKLSA